MTSQGLLQSRKQRESLFAQRREVASNATKGQGTIPTAKTARNFLLNFDHAKIAFGLRIVKRHAEVNQESQDGILVLGSAGRANCGPRCVCVVRVWVGRLGLPEGDWLVHRPGE